MAICTNMPNEFHAAAVLQRTIAEVVRIRKDHGHVQETLKGPIRVTFGDLKDAFIGDANDPLTWEQIAGERESGRYEAGNECLPVGLRHAPTMSCRTARPVTISSHDVAFPCHQPPATSHQPPATSAVTQNGERSEDLSP